MKNILVTGGAGYIGSVVSEMLIANGCQVTVVDDLRDGHAAAVADGSRLLQVDICAAEGLRSVFSRNRFDAVVHLAAEANVPNSVRDPLLYYENNIVGTLNVLSGMREFGVKDIVFSSTAAVYGAPLYTPIDENHARQPVNPYGRSKLMDEEMLADCAAAYGIQYVIFRFFCAAGATALHGESRKCETHLIPVVIDQILGRREKVVVYGRDFDTLDGSGVRDYVHVEDIARAHVLALSRMDSCANQVFNLGTGKGYTVMQVIEATADALGHAVKYEDGPRRVGDPPNLVATCAKAEQWLGWRPEKGLADMIISAHAWRKSPLYGGEYL